MDSKIIKGLKTNDNDSIEAIYNNCFPSIEAYVINNSGSNFDAKDIFHDGLIVLYNKLKEPNFELKVELKTYLYSICSRMWLKRLQRRKLFNEIQKSPEFKALEMGYIADFELESQLAFIRRKIFSLNSGCKRLLLLFLEGHSLEDIATKLNYTYNYTKKKKFTCKELLKRMIKEDRHFRDYFE